jgi:hypothetical protein
MDNNKTYTKAQLLEMNKSPVFGHNWITHIDDIGTNEMAQICPTGDAGLGGRIWRAFPASLVLTQEVKWKYNLW